MEIRVKREKFAKKYTLGKMYVPGLSGYIPTVEDVVREGEKVHGATAIPAGRYHVVLNVVSPKFSRYPFYMEVCGGKVPRLLEVPNFDGVLVHCGRNESNTSGCILLNDYDAPLDRSKEYFKLFYNAVKNSDEIWLEIE